MIKKRITTITLCLFLHCITFNIFLIHLICFILFLTNQILSSQILFIMIIEWFVVEFNVTLIYILLNIIIIITFKYNTLNIFYILYL